MTTCGEEKKKPGKREIDRLRMKRSGEPGRPVGQTHSVPLRTHSAWTLLHTARRYSPHRHNICKGRFRGNICHGYEKCRGQATRTRRRKTSSKGGNRTGITRSSKSERRRGTGEGTRGRFRDKTGMGRETGRETMEVSRE
jgi:hypothetical protein